MHLDSVHFEFNEDRKQNIQGIYKYVRVEYINFIYNFFVVASLYIKFILTAYELIKNSK